ncbi:MAG: MlaC/ttg2D family ABC transporter substrate-binding protein, partial [Endozoicomonas sp.]
MKSQARVPAFLGAMMMVMMLWASLSMAAPAPLESPRGDVETITRGLLKTFEANLDQYKKDGDAFVAEVDRHLSPVVAFDSIARGVMGKYTRRAKPDQIEQFSGVFKDSLISFYGKALLKLDSTSLTIDKIDPVPDSVLQDYRNGKARQVPVDMMVKTSTKTVAISYSMVHVDGR